MSRRRDILHGLSPAMRSVLADLLRSAIVLVTRGWLALAIPAHTHAPGTIEALRRRQLIIIDGDALSLTHKGRICAVEIARRARVHRKLFGAAA